MRIAAGRGRARRRACRRSDRARPERRPVARRTATSRSSSRSSKPACRPSSTPGRPWTAQPLAPARRRADGRARAARRPRRSHRVRAAGRLLARHRGRAKSRTRSTSTIVARHAGREHRFEYESYEGRTTIAADVARAAGIGTATAGPGTISDELVLYGAIAPDATRVRAVHARFPGVIRSVSRNVGDAVRAGDALATIESNESLQTYTVTAPIAGTVTARHAAPGEQTDDDALFEIADFSSVWAELDVFSRDRAAAARPGSPSPSRRQRRRRRRAPSTTSRRSATARRRASRRASCSTTPTAAGRRGSSSRAA